MWHSGFQFSHIFLLHVTWILCGNQPSKQHQPNRFLARQKFGNTCFMCLIRRVANIIRFLHFAHLAICCSRFAREWDLNSEQGMPLKPSVFHQSRNWNSLGPRRDHKKEAKELYTPSLSSCLLWWGLASEVDYGGGGLCKSVWGVLGPIQHTSNLESLGVWRRAAVFNASSILCLITAKLAQVGGRTRKDWLQGGPEWLMGGLPPNFSAVLSMNDFQNHQLWENLAFVWVEGCLKDVSQC